MAKSRRGALAVIAGIGGLLYLFPQVPVILSETPIPLTDAPATYAYASPFGGGVDSGGGGLYGNGANQPDAAYSQRAIDHVSQIQPLDSAGNPDPRGRILFTSIGMSNTEDHFLGFIGQYDARLRPGNPALLILNGAQGADDAVAWDETEEPWDTLVNGIIGPQRVNQVQAIWMSQAHRSPNENGSGQFPGEAALLSERLKRAAIRALQEFPNLKVVYLSSRMSAVHVDPHIPPHNLPPGEENRLPIEPFAYETGFAVRWAIQDQMSGDPSLNWDAAQGPVMAPLMLWGPYLWTKGSTPRRDGLAWFVDDFKRPFDPHPLEWNDDPDDPSRPFNVTKGAAKSGYFMVDWFLANPLAAPWFNPNAAQ